MLSRNFFVKGTENWGRTGGGSGVKSVIKTWEVLQVCILVELIK